MAQQGVVTKIYELKTIGYQDRHNEFKTLSEDLTKIKKLLLELKGMKLTVGDSKSFTEVNVQIQQAEGLQGKLETRLKENISLREQESTILKKVGSDQGNLTSAYYKLLQQSREAAANAKNLAAAYGVESEQAKAAAIAAGEYKAKLDEINQLVKSGGVTPASPATPLPKDIPFTTNLGDLEKEREAIQQKGSVINDLDKEQAEAANSATAMGAASMQAGEEIKNSGAAVIESQTRFQEYTGTIRQNIEAQIENNTALAANRAEQKQIEKAIGDSGTATNAQISRLATLSEEEQILVETNKALTLTIRNQSKELIAAIGSLDEMQAQLNQIQQAYEALSDTEKASPFGQQLKKEIDDLEPKVKSLEAELGKFQRNVGNYPQAFGGAFKVLNDELDAIQAKIVSGNFSGKELDDLVAKQQTLQVITNKVGKEFTTTASAAAAYKEAGRQLGQTFGTNSEIFKQYSAQVSSTNKELKKADIQLSSTQKKGKGLFTVIYGGLRQIANAIPGIGIGGLVAMLLAPLESIASSLFTVGKRAKEATDKMKLFEEIRQEAFKNSSLEITQLNGLVSAARNENLTRQQRNAAISELQKEYPAYLKNINLENISSKETQEAIDQLTESILKKAIADEYAQRIAALAVKQNDLRNNITKTENQLIKNRSELLKEVNQEGDRYLRPGQSGTVAARRTEQIKLNKSLGDYNKELKTTNENIDDLTSGYKEAQAAALAVIKQPPGGGTKKTSSERKDAFREIEAIRDRLLAVLGKMRMEDRLDEESFLSHEYAVNINAINRKLELLKGANVEEKKVISQLNLEKVKLEQDLVNKVYALRSKAAKDQLDIITKNAQEEADLVKNDSNASEFEKAEAQLKADKSILAAQLQFNQQMDALEKERNDASNKNAEDRQRDIRTTEQKITKDQKELLLARIEDSKKAGEKLQAEFELSIDRAELLIRADTSLSQLQKEARIRELENERQFGVLARQAATYTELQELFKKAYDAGVVTLAQYEEVVNKLNELQGKIAKSPEQTGKGFFDGVKLGFGDNIIGYLQKAGEEFGKKVFGDNEKGENAGKAAALLISQSYSLAQSAMSNYFDAEQARIRQNLELQLERLDIEKEQVIARAQSQAEIDSLEKQYAAKKKEEEKKAQEQLKKSRRSEAKLALAAELANIWATVWTLGPIAGPIAGAIFSGLALGRYQLRLSEINREQFKRGGMPNNGGEIKGPSHKQGGVPFSMDKFEAQGKELAIINKKSAEDSRVRTITGTNKQIASMINELGGGVSFAKGAKLTKYARGGYIGENLQPPVWSPSNTAIVASTDNSGIVEELQELKKEFKNEIHQLVNEQSARIDRIKVNVLERDISNAQAKKEKQSAVGTL